MLRATQYLLNFFFLMIRRPPRSTLFSLHDALPISGRKCDRSQGACPSVGPSNVATSVTSSAASKDRKSTRLNSSHSQISYAVFCLKKKKKLPFARLSSH